MILLVLGIRDIILLESNRAVMNVFLFADFRFDDLARELLYAILLRDFWMRFLKKSLWSFLIKI